MCFDDGREHHYRYISCKRLTHVAAGPRYTDFVTQFPSLFSAAASFDRELMEERAVRIGWEFRGKGINVALAPVRSTFPGPQS